MQTALEVRKKEQRTDQQCMVTLPELARGGIAVVFSTVHAHAKEFVDGFPSYDPPARVQALEQLEVYQRWEEEGLVRIIRDVASLKSHISDWKNDRKLGIVLLMEGSDPIESVDEVDKWYANGLRLIGPAWSQTRHAGGTARPGGLTPEGRELVAAMKERGIALDASHLAEEAFWEALQLGVHRVIATHSNSRSLISTDRQLSDEMVRALGDAGGVTGIVLYNGFLDPAWKSGSPKIPLDAVRLHAERFAELIGWDHVGIGSDFDGGLGYEETPEGLDTAADLWRVSMVIPDHARQGVLGGNWIRFLESALPG